MRVATLSCGAVVVHSNGTEWLFGAPEGVGTALKEAGLFSSLADGRFVFTTNMRAPGLGGIDGPVVRFKNEPLSKGGLRAMPVEHKHGYDYVIEADGARVLFSERGDVSVADTDGMDLAVIKNKNRADAWGSNVITWPWPDSEFFLNAFKIYSSLEDAPANLKKMDGVPLTLGQINGIVKQAEGIPEGEVDEPWAVAKGNFKKTHVVKDGRWVKREGKAEKSEAGETASHELSRSAAKEAGKNSEGRTASDHLVVEDPEGPDTWHLPVKTDGKPDRGLMGAAAAALAAPGGHRGKKYEGPDKAKAIRKLVAMYNDMDLDIPPNLKTAYERLKELSDILQAESIPNVPDIAEGEAWSTVFKEGDKWHWAGITSTATWDLQDEFVSTEAMDWAIKFASIVGPGPLRYRHIPGLDGGVCTKQTRVGGFLFERGTFDDTLIGQAMKELMSSDPTWRLSPGLAYGAHDLVDGVYRRMLMFERSMTQRPANPITSILAHDAGGMNMNVKQLSENQLKDVADELGLELGYVQKLHAQALAGGGIKSMDAFMTTLKESKGKKVDEEEEADMEEEDEEEEAESRVKELVAGLDADQRSALKSLLDEVEEENRDPVDVLRGELATQIKELRVGQESVAAAVAALAQAMSGLSTKEAGDEGTSEAQMRRVLEEIMSASPRRQAAQFATKAMGGEGNLSDVDAAILAKLEDIQTQVKSAGQPFGHGGSIYDAFTSTRLNHGQRSQ